MPPRATDQLTVDGHSIQISNPDKILFPQAEITKGEFVAYYDRVAEYMLEHVQGRPLSMERFPDGIHGERFYQKEVPEYFPGFVDRVDVKAEEGTPKHYATAANRATIVYLANLVTIPHIWMSCKEDLRNPDRMVWDLDPMGLPFEQVKTAGKLLRYLLGEIGVTAYPMVTGSRGLHVIAFVRPVHDVDEIFDFTKKVAQLITRKLPQLFTVTYTKSKRGKKIYIDYHRNVYAQTAVAPYAVRSIEGAPIAMPIRWDDLENDELEPTSFTIRNVFERLEDAGDSWIGGIDVMERIDAPLERVDEFLEASRIRR